MTDIYDKLIDEIEATPYIEAPRGLEEIRKIDTDVAPIAVQKRAPVVKKARIIAHEDLLDKVHEFTRPLCDTSCELLSNPIVTTVTLSGNLSGVKFHEQELIEKIDPRGNIVILECNYGRKVLAGWEHIDQVKKSNRGRKKQVKPRKRQRKIQGNGECFNSQLTFVVVREVPKYILDSSSHVRKSKNRDETLTLQKFKIKVFRTGVIQIPGGRPELLPYIVSACEEIAVMLDGALRTDASLPPIAICNLHPVMKDYKFYVNLEKRQLLDLYMLKLIFIVDMMRQRNILMVGDTVNSELLNRLMAGVDDEGKQNTITVDYSYAAYTVMTHLDCIPKAPYPRILDSKYTYEETKLALLFNTPIPGNADKKTRVNIFLGGNIVDDIYGAKIDILGALLDTTTREIYRYLLDTFERYMEYVVIEPSDDDNEYMVLDDTLPDNIVCDDPAKTIDRVYKKYGYIIVLPALTYQQDEDAKGFIESIFSIA